MSQLGRVGLRGENKSRERTISCCGSGYLGQAIQQQHIGELRAATRPVWSGGLRPRGVTAYQRRQLGLRNPKARKSTIQADQKLREYQDAGIGKMFETGEMDHHLTSKFRLIGRTAEQTRHNVPN